MTKYCVAYLLPDVGRVLSRLIALCMDEEPFDLPPPGVPGSLLESLDQLIVSLPPADPLRGELLELRMLAAEQEDMVGEARQAIEKMEAIVKKVTSPANRIGTFLGAQTMETAQIVVGGAITTATSIRGSTSTIAAPRHARAGQ